MKNQLLRLSTPCCRIILLGTASAFVVAAPALAQSLAPATAGQGEAISPSVPDNAAAANDSTGEIIVTAQRRSERLSQVPISITAYSGAALAQTGVLNSRGLTQITPGLNFQSVGNYAQPVIRGVGSSGTSLGDSPNVATYVDGVYQPFGAYNFQSFSDLERIEVLKGPQGTLFGRNATGGAISVTTLSPSFTPSGKIGVSYGRFNNLQTYGFVTAPLNADTLAFSLSSEYERNSGFRRDINLDKKVGFLRRYMTRGKLLFEPANQLSMQLTGYYSHAPNDLTTFGNQPLDGDTFIRALLPDIQLATKPNTSSLNIVPVNRLTTWGFNFKVTADLGWATLTSLSAMVKNKNFVYTDSDLSPVSNLQTKIHDQDDTLSQDLTLTSNGSGSLSWLAGATYYRERATRTVRTRGGLLVFDPAPPLLSGLDAHNKTDAYAVFGELTWKVADRLNIVGGLRYSLDKPSFSGAPIIVASGAFGPGVANSASYHKVTPRFAVRYAVTPEINAYASYTRGFKAGVFNSGSLQVPPAAPETIDAYEIGVKGAPSAAFSFNTAAYYYDYKDVQFSSFGNVTTVSILRNAAHERIYGFEANATVVPFTGLSLRGGAAYTHGEYTSFPGAQGFRPRTDAAGVPVGGNVSFSFDASGRPALRTPRLAINGTIAYVTELANGGSVSFDINGSRTGRIIYDLAGSFQQKAFQIFNASASYTLPDDHWRATLFGTNIFDATPIAGVLISTSTTSVTYQQPATYGARIEYRF